MESERHGAIALPSTLKIGTRNLNSTQAWCCSATKKLTKWSMI